MPRGSGSGDAAILSNRKRGVIMSINPQANSYRGGLENKVRVCRHNLLLAVVFTAVNVLLLVTNSNSYFLFSLVLPYRFVLNGMLFGGYFPKEFYVDELDEADDFTVIRQPGILISLCAMAAIILGLYLLFFFMSKRNGVWLIPSLVFIILDTLVYMGIIFLYGFEISDILDLVFHGWIVYYAVTGVMAASKLQKLPPESEVPANGWPDGAVPYTAEMAVPAPTPAEEAGGWISAENAAGDQAGVSVSVGMEPADNSEHKECC